MRWKDELKEVLEFAKDGLDVSKIVEELQGKIRRAG